MPSRTARWLALLFLCSFPAAASLERAPELRIAQRLPDVSMQQLAAQPRPTATLPHEQRRESATRAQARTAFTTNVVPAPAATLPPVHIAGGFSSAYDNLGRYPSDANGAVGPRHVLTTSNTDFLVHDRTGKTLSDVTIDQFWHDPAAADGALYDTRAAYDTAADRWIIVSLYDVSYADSAVLVAVSLTGDPSASWKRFRFKTDPGGSGVADYARIALTTDSLLVTANVESDYGLYADIWVIKKAELLSSFPPSAVQLHSSLPELTPVASDRAEPPRFAVARGGQLLLYTLNGTTLTQTSAIGSPFTYGDSTIFATAIAPQLGSPTAMDVGDPTVHYAIARSGVLWVVQAVYVSSPTRAAIVWWQIPLNGGTTRSGMIVDPTGSFSFPSLAVNRSGTAFIGYAFFRSDIYPSAGAIIVDASGNSSTNALVKGGETPSRTSRWADFSGSVVDPLNDLDFWTVQSYPRAESQGSRSGAWATWWTHLDFPPPARTRAARH